MPASCYVTTYPTASAWDWPSATAAAPSGSGNLTAAGPLPLASGTKADCSGYDQYYQSGSSGNGTSYDVNSCYSVASFHDCKPFHKTLHYQLPLPD